MSAIIPALQEVLIVLRTQEWNMQKNNPPKCTLECAKRHIRNDRIFKHFIHISDGLIYKL